MYTMGVAEREPVKMYGTAALVESGAAASTAIFAAFLVGREQGIGQHVDFAIADSQLCGNDRRHATVIAYEFSGRRTPRQGAGAMGIAAGVYPCADGYVEFTAAATRIDRVSDMLGRPDWLDDPKWLEPGAMFNPALIEEFAGHFYAWLAERDKREIWAEARRARVLCGPLFTVREIFDDPHFRERGFWETVRHAEMGAIEMPGRPFIMPDSPWRLRRPAPLLGEHTADVLREAGYAGDQIQELAREGVTGVRA
jgi:crotonobetainyl-CoA:carnitine CoA-transferase CaiB-like acyl-CoA transferase